MILADTSPPVEASDLPSVPIVLRRPSNRVKEPPSQLYVLLRDPRDRCSITRLGEDSVTVLSLWNLAPDPLRLLAARVVHVGDREHAVLRHGIVRVIGLVGTHALLEVVHSFQRDIGKVEIVENHVKEAWWLRGRLAPVGGRAGDGGGGQGTRENRSELHVDKDLTLVQVSVMETLGFVYLRNDLLSGC